MIRLAYLASVGMLLAGCNGSSAPPAELTPTVRTTSASPASITDTHTGLARYDGYGDTRFGMDEAAFRAAWPDSLSGTLDAGGACSFLRPQAASHPRIFGFMFEQGLFVRVDVGDASEIAPGGGKVGMEVAQLRGLYGDAMTTSPHKYVDGASTLRVASPDGSGALVFETDAHGSVTAWRVGVTPQIDYLEGCG